MKNGNDGGIRRVVVATGIASVADQLVFVREYLAQFKGNEIVIALIFFCWLTLGAVGTAAAKGRGRSSRPPSATLLAWLSCLLPVVAVAQVVAIRQLRDWVFLRGVSVGFYATFGFVALTVGPCALLVGYLLPYSLRVVRQRQREYPGNRIYMADNLGDMAGGAIFSFFLVYWLTPLWMILAVHLPLLATLLFLDGVSRRRVLVTGLLTVAVLLAAAGFETSLLPIRDGQRVHYAESRYGRIEVVVNGGEVTVFSDGQPTLFSTDPALAEEVVHFPLSQVDRPRRLLLISAVGGIMAEVVKYHPERVDYVELDPMVADIQQRYGLVTPIPGLRVINADARAFLAASTRRYDAILVNLPEPETYQLNRFFTTGFFGLAQRHLAPGGVLSFGIEGVADYVSDTRARVISSLANTAERFFDQVTLFPGQRLIFVCREEPIATDIARLLAQRGIRTDHIRRYFAGDLTAARMAQVRHRLDPDVPLNLDLAPHLMQLAFVNWFTRHGESPMIFILVLGAAALIYIGRISRTRWVLLTSGCINIGAEMVCIFAFQVFYGYIYLEIGVLVTVFLAGLLPGAWLGGSISVNRPRVLRAADASLCLLLVLLAVSLTTVRQALPPTLFYLFGLAISFCCGLQFPLVLKISGDTTAAATGSFSCDLTGAAVGVLLISLVMIPFLGLVQTAFCLAGIKLVSLAVAGGIHEAA